MNIRLLSLLVFVPIFGFSQSGGEKEINVSSGKTLETDLKTGGSLNIAGWDKDVVKIDYTKRGRDADDCIIDIEEFSGGVRISSRYEGSRNNRSSDIQFDIKVPAKFNLDLQSMGGGIAIENVEGTVNGKTMGGALELNGLKGVLGLTTMGGKVRLTNSDVDGYVKTMGGQVLVEDVKGDVQVTSNGGNIVQRNVTRRSGEGIKNEVNIKTMGGDINVDDAPEGADVKTMGGTIHIRRAARYAHAKTNGGDIVIDEIDGSVQAKTNGGDISVTMTGDPSKGDRSVDIESNSGDITLTVPPSLSMDVDITLAYTKDHDGDCKITSDFDIQQTTSQAWEDRHGSPRKYIYGKGTSGQGGNRVVIKTINGNVWLKKG